MAALTRYRVWRPWRFFISTVVIGAAVAAVVAVVANLSVMMPWAQASYLALALAGPVAWTAAGLGVGASLRRTGVARAR